tara:strand:+ start:86 stop:1282 length:1197 start_codon:yes stop_codon:yes gene_type:complete
LKKNKESINAFWKKNKKIKKLFDIFGSKNIKFVGGAVRSALRNETTNDLDLAVNIKFIDVKKQLEKSNIKFTDNSKGHGTISIFSRIDKIEITSLRRDVKTDGRKAKIEHTKSFEEDSLRRDFTINSIYADYDGEVYDPNDGYKDLKSNVVRFIGSPEKRINEDYLRLLRYFRMIGLYSSNELEIDKESLRACIHKFEKIKNLSKERVQSEFYKLILTKNSSFSLYLLKKHNLLDYIVKGLQKLPANDIKYFNKLPEDLIVRLTYLIIRTNVNLIEIRKSLNISNRHIAIIKTILSNKRGFTNILEAKINKYLYGADISLTNYFVYCHINNRKPNSLILDILNNWETPKLPINGRDILKFKNLKGKKIGLRLKMIENWWIDNDFMPNRTECLLKLKKD